MDGLDENANRYIRNRIICPAVITLAAVAAALLVGTAWGYTKYRSYYNSASERREIAEGMAWYDENVPQINEAYEQGNFADIREVTADSYKNKILQPVSYTPLDMTTAPPTAITIPTARRTFVFTVGLIMFPQSLFINTSSFLRIVKLCVCRYLLHQFFMRTGYCLSISQPDYLIHLREQIQSM